MANLIDSIASGNPAAALANLYDTIEVRSSVSPPVRLNVASLVDSGQPSKPSWFAQMLKPTVVLSGSGGRAVVAPYGEAGDGTLITVLTLGGLFGLGVLVGRLSK